MVVLARKFRPSVSTKLLSLLLLLLLLLFYQLLRIVEEQNSIGLFDTGFSFKSIHDLQQGERDSIFLKPLNHFHPPHRCLLISRVITEDS